MAETAIHHALKSAAAEFLLREQCQVVGVEVRCPRSRYRADVAAYRDRLPWPKDEDDHGRSTLWSTATPSARSHDRRIAPETIIIECKASRSDFLRDQRDVDSLLQERDELIRWRRHLEETTIRRNEPELRRNGTALFRESEEWDFARSRLPSYRQVLRRLRRIEKQIYGQTKFCLMRQYCLATHLYICTPPGLIRTRELPECWGLLECTRRGVVMKREATRLMVKADQQQQLLRNLAMAATRQAWSSTA